MTCKRCAMDYVRQSRPSGAIDRFLMEMHMVPYRCQICAHRFWVMAWGKGASDLQDDKREYQRLGANFPIFFKGEQVSGEGIVTALSIRGCSIETSTRMQHGTVVSLILKPPGITIPIDIDSAVVKAALGKRLGLEFVNIDAGEEERLRGYIETLIVTGPGELRKMYFNL
ncbi:MAG TPA: PilZ domain-containing protein [Nitrospirales bacterium]